MDAHEQEILAHLRQGQRNIRKVVNLLMERYEVDILNYCLRLHNRDKGQAQKLAEQVFQEAHKELLTYSGNSLRTPLYTLAFKLWEAHNRTRLLEEIDDDKEGQAPPLSAIDRAIIHLRAQGESWKEIGHILHIVPNTATQRLKRIKDRRQKGDDEHV